MQLTYFCGRYLLLSHFRIFIKAKGCFVPVFQSGKWLFNLNKATNDVRKVGGKRATIHQADTPKGNRIFTFLHSRFSPVNYLRINESILLDNDRQTVYSFSPFQRRGALYEPF